MGNTSSSGSESEEKQSLSSQNSKLKEKNEICQDNFIYNLDQKNLAAYLIGNNSARSDILIPSYIMHKQSKYIVVSISFQNCKTIKTVRFASDSKLQIIEESSFKFSKIESIKIPESVTEIGSNAFSFCSQLKFFEFHPNSKIQSINGHTFSNSSIERISIPSTVTEIGSSAFQGCEHLRQIEIPTNSQLQKIGYGAFDSTLIESISIPSDVSIRNQWGQDTEYLKKINLIPRNKPCLDYYQDEFIIGKSNRMQDMFDVLAFAPRNIKFFTIPKFIKQIGSFAFANTLITSIFIPNHVTHIHISAFSECKNLSNVEFQTNSQLEIIDHNAFSLTAIKKISIPQHVTQIKNGSFESCSQLKYIEIPENSELKKIGVFAFYRSSIESFFVPSLVEEIEAFAFDNSCLQIIEFAENFSLKSIDRDAFPVNESLIITMPCKMNVHNAYTRF